MQYQDQLNKTETFYRSKMLPPSDQREGYQNSHKGKTRSEKRAGKEKTRNNNSVDDVLMVIIYIQQGNEQN